MPDEQLHRLATETPNPSSQDLDLLSTEDMLRVFNGEDRKVAEAVGQQIPQIARVVEVVAHAFEQGGQLHYFGAGTSGRLGILDASEMPPTFGVSQHLVQGHMAGGNDAIIIPVEGAEDRPELGEQDVIAADLSENDVAIALSASGRAPYCIAALTTAKERGASTAAIVCNPSTPLHQVADITVAPEVGPEVLTGSTRLKSGTAQKLVLNMITTGAMVRIGYTFGNLMVGMTPTNIKLQDRARRLVTMITKHKDVEPALIRCGWNVRATCIHLMRGKSPEEAHALLKTHRGSLRQALDATA